MAFCPYDVFVMGYLSDEQLRAMPPLVKIRLWAHGKKTR